MTEKLTRWDSQAVRPNSSVARALRRADYVEFDDQAGNGLWWIIITPAGRAALQQEVRDDQ